MNNLADVVLADQWSGAEGTHKNLPLVVRFRHEIARDTFKSKHSQLVQVRWDYGNHQTGMPSGEDSQKMETFEDRLVEAIETDLSGVLAGVVTTNGYRIWVIYVMDIDIFSERLHCMPQEEWPYPIRIETSRDAAWDFFFDNVRSER